ncbi:MAG: aminopeptidase [Chloroflexota bacterium]
MAIENFEEKLKKYADVVVQVGLNLQPGQRLLIRPAGSVESVAPLVRAVSKSAYEAGCRYVDVMWSDEDLGVIRLENAPDDSFKELPAYKSVQLMEYAENGDASLGIIASNPDAMAGQDQAKMAAMRKAASKVMADYRKISSSMKINWCGVGAASPGWAQKVFPDLPAEDATDALWESIFKFTRLDLDDPVQAWKDHVAKLTERKAYLNGKQYKSLRLNGPGTDLTIDLAEAHIWMGGSVSTPEGTIFVPNMPTEEVFTTPNANGVNGTVSTSLPLNFNGMVLEGMKFTFKDGVITEFSSDTGQEMFEKILDMDPGARRLGEVALVPNSSPISQSGTLFYNTLYDENASNHLAIGQAYAAAVEGGIQMSQEEKDAAGINTSLIHIDFMIGSDKMDVDGITADGMVEPVMRAGEWAF